MTEQGTTKQGGKRPGAGRPKVKEPTVVMRVPLSLVDYVRQLIRDKDTSKKTTI